MPYIAPSRSVPRARLPQGYAGTRQGGWGAWTRVSRGRRASHRTKRQRRQQSEQVWPVGGRRPLCPTRRARRAALHGAQANVPNGSGADTGWAGKAEHMARHNGHSPLLQCLRASAKLTSVACVPALGAPLQAGQHRPLVAQVAHSDIIFLC